MEDAAQAQVHVYNGRLAGTFEDVGVFSAHGGKAILTSGRKAGDAGLAGHRFDARGMSDIKARLIQLQEPKLADILASRQRNVLRCEVLLGSHGLVPAGFPPTGDNLFVKVLLSPKNTMGRNQARILFRGMLRAGVEPESTYILPHLRVPFAAYPETAIARVEEQAPSAFAVPARPNLGLDDWRRIQMVVRISSRLKLNTKKSKYILRRAIDGVLPAARKARRIKRGFSVPVSRRFRGGLADYARPILLDKSFLDKEYFDPNGTKEVLGA